MFEKFQNYMQNYAFEKTRVELMGMTDRQLEDVGISRALLEGGVHNWPWRESAAQPAKMDSKQINKAIRELSAMSDKDLRDIGIHRGAIRHSVIHGVTGRDPQKVA